MKRLILGETFLALFYLVIAFLNNGLSYSMLISIPLVYTLLIIYMPNKKDL